MAIADGLGSLVVAFFIMLIIIKNRKDLVRKQKAVIDEVNRHDYNHPKSQEALRDFQRWTDESGVFKDRKGEKFVATFQKKINPKG